MDKVSIIIPIHNSATFLEECISSVEQQTYSEIEVILIDDHSTDASSTICDSYVKKNNKFRYYKLEEGRGVSAARNMGLEKASGKYVMFIDSDDSLYVDSCENLIRSVGDFDLVIASYRSFGAALLEQRAINSDFFFQSVQYYLEKWLIQSVWAKLFKKEIIDRYQIKFKEGMIYGEDTLFLYEYINKTKNVKSIDVFTYKYRILNVSLSHRFIIEKFETDCLLCQKLLGICENNLRESGLDEIVNFWVVNCLPLYLIEACKNLEYFVFKQKLLEIRKYELVKRAFKLKLRTKKVKRQVVKLFANVHPFFLYYIGKPFLRMIKH